MRQESWNQIESAGQNGDMFALTVEGVFLYENSNLINVCLQETSLIRWMGLICRSLCLTTLSNQTRITS